VGLGIFSQLNAQFIESFVVGAAVLEDTIVKAMSLELGLKLENESTVFEDRIRRLKESYNDEGSKLFQNL
jgi:hypothetical protein